MSIVFPYKRKDFLAPSKALQELKKKLGPVYFDAKLIECPQNAVELGKLLQKCEELDKQKFKKISEASREQRILQNSLSSRKIRNVSSVSLLSRPSSTSTFVDITNKNAPPPGFRFHANGDPKADILLTAEELNQDSKTTIPSRTSNYDGDSSPLLNETRLSRSEDETSRYDSITSAIKQTDLEYEEIDYSKEIENLEAIILELEAQLAIGAEKEDGQTVTKRNYLKAHSHADDLESCLNRPSANYAYDPDVKYKRDRYHLETAAVGPNFATVIKKTSKCLACQFKLKHVGNEFAKPIKKKEVLKERWNIPPSGSFLSSPNLSLSSSPSLASSRLWSRSSVRGKSLQELPSVMASKTSSRWSADLTSSLTNSRTSSRDLYGRVSSVSCGSSLRRFVSPMQRESRLQILKSQAEQDIKECQSKVDAFLGKLDKKTSSKSRVRWKNY